MPASPLFALLKKDVLLEWRQKHTLFGVLLYAGSTVFVIYTMAGRPDAAMWNVLFWMTQLFIAVNSVAKSFLGEPQERFRYYYTLVKPATFLSAKFIYSILLMLLMGTLALGLFALLLGTPLEQAGLFVIVAITGAISLSSIFTFLSAIAARAGQNATLMAILGFPLITPILMILSRLALKAISPVYQAGWWKLGLTLLGTDALVIVVGIILFPFLWQE